MTDKSAKDIQVKQKQEVSTPAEETRPGLVFTPNVDIFETDQNITLLADLPGVKPENLTIDLRDNILTLTGEIEPFEGAKEQDVFIEYEIGRYHRQFNLSSVIDQSKINAAMDAGVLRLLLPKVEKATPRKIEVQTG